MKYNLLHALNEIISFKANNDFLIYKNKSKQIIVSGEKLFDDVYDDIHIKNEFLMFNKEGNALVYDLKNKNEKLKIDFEILSSKNILNKSIVLIDKNQSLYLSSLDLSNINKLEIGVYSWGSLLLYEELFLVYNKNSVICYSIHSNKLWQYNLTQLGDYETVRTNEVKTYELLKFIGVWQDELLVACTDGLILSLNIHTGEERRRFHQCPEYPLGSIVRKKFHDANAFVLDVSKNILMALNSYFYMEIDLNTNAVKIIDIRENMAEVNIDFLRQSRDYAWDDNYIYSIGYVANHTSGIAKGDRCILAFNRHTYKIDWQYIFEDDSINTEIPQLAGNKLYQLTANKVLHIFEKTEV